MHVYLHVYYQISGRRESSKIAWSGWIYTTIELAAATRKSTATEVQLPSRYRSAIVRGSDSLPPDKSDIFIPERAYWYPEEDSFVRIVAVPIFSYDIVEFSMYTLLRLVLYRGWSVQPKFLPSSITAWIILCCVWYGGWDGIGFPTSTTNFLPAIFVDFYHIIIIIFCLQLLLNYLTSAVMKEIGQPPVTYTLIQEAFFREFPTSKYKSVSAVKRRLNALFKKKVELSANLHICVTETIHEMVRKME